VDKKKSISFSQIEERIRGFLNGERVVFTGAEPTIREDIVDLLKLAKKRKIKIIQLNTNARRLADKKFAQKVVETGANYFKVSLHGFNARLHNKITQTKNSFEETIKGIRNLIKLEQKDNIVLSIVLGRFNYRDLVEILKLVRQIGLKKVQLNIVKTNNKDLIVPLEILSKYVSQARYRFFFDFLIKAKNVPYCLIPEPESLFLHGNKSKEFKYLSKCKKCKYNKVCSGLLINYVNSSNVSKIKAFLDLPAEVMIEVETRCNFNCQFCFNRTSFASSGHGIHGLETEYIKKIINSIKKSKVPRIRFTGGEPLLREDIFELIRYAKSKDLEVRLNTNGYLINSYSYIKEMTKYLDYVLFSLHSYNPKKDEEITGVKHSFEKKIRVIKWFRKAGIKIIRINTIATLENIKNLDKFYDLLKELRVDRWAVNRLIPVSKRDKSWKQEELSILIEKLIKIKKDKIKNDIPMEIHIVNAVPFCADDPVRLNSICSGGRSVDGHERFVVDPRGFAKPIYYMGKNIGDPLDILDCWNHSFMKSLRNYEVLPKECKKCFFLEKCKGGNRFCAYIVNGSYDSKDPLMDYSRIKNYIW
jgi:radical SAM protein with 4Fe4S-binding SPASM domain